jgi:hypothetical protein
MSGAALVSYLPALSALGAALTVLKLLKTRLYLRYRVFLAYLVFHALCLSLALVLDPSSRAYFLLWVFSQLSWLFYIGMVFELYRLILERHKGLYTLGRWAMYAGIVVSVTISALALLPRITPQMAQVSKFMGYAVAGERGVDFSLAIFLLLMMFLLTWYTVPLSRNVVSHAVIYTVFFLSSEMGLILKSVFGFRNIGMLNNGLMAMSAACTLAWFFLLSRNGEEARVKLPWIDPEQERRILYQLDSLNATLLKAARK